MEIKTEETIVLDNIIDMLRNCMIRIGSIESNLQRLNTIETNLLPKLNNSLQKIDTMENSLNRIEDKINSLITIVGNKAPQQNIRVV